MYNIDTFHQSFRRKSPIYYDVYQYLLTQRPGLDEICLNLRCGLFDDSLDLESHYRRVCKQCRGRMDVAVAWWAAQTARLTARYSEKTSRQLTWEDVKNQIAASGKKDAAGESRLVELHEIVALMKYVYIDLQWPLLLNNAVLNKVFFEELLMERLGTMSAETGVDLLELLTLLDNSTEHRYIPLSQGNALTAIDARLGSVANEFMALSCKFSLQKHSERAFNETFVSWSPMVIDMRDAIGCYLESFGLCKRRDLDCMPIYDLLPLMDDKHLPTLYLR